MKIAMCTTCSMDTAGNHEWNCPNFPVYQHNYQTFVPTSRPITDEEAEKIKKGLKDWKEMFDKDLADRHEKLFGNQVEP